MSSRSSFATFRHTNFATWDVNKICKYREIRDPGWSLTRKTSTLCWRPNLDYRISTPFAIHYQFHQNALFIVSRVLFKIFYFFFRQIKLECVLWLNRKKTKFWKFWPDFVNSNLKARLHRRFLSQQLNANFVAPKLQLQNCTCKPFCDFGARGAVCLKES